jgi:predicted MPP superfamily phosphohydrolase
MSVFNKPLTRRQALAWLAIPFGPSLLGSIYGIGVEPHRPKVERIDISLENFPGKLCVVHLSDLHVHKDSLNMRRAVELSNNLKPDYVFITGDLVEKPEELPVCLRLISKLKYKNRMYFVPGNWEHWSGTLSDGLITKLESIGVRTLFNEGEIIKWSGGEFFLVGIDDDYYGKPDIKKAFKYQPNDMSTILLSHAPMGVFSAQLFRCDLVLAGHTHGGQVNIPGFGAVTTPPGSGPFERGLYYVKRSKLYVNRGIGTSVFPIRIMCPPEVTYLTIKGI